MALVSWARLPAHPDDARARAISSHCFKLFPVWRFRLYGTHPCSAVQHRNCVDGLVLAALSRQMGRDRCGIDDGHFAIYAVLRALRPQRVVYRARGPVTVVFDSEIS